MRRAAAFALCVLVLLPAGARAKPDDPYYVFQWGLKKVHAEPAWTVSKGRGSVVAVVDTGVSPSHPDLQGRLLAGKDFIDDDEDPRDENGHGTLVAGIIAATTSNGKGVASMAPGAAILPVRVLDEDGAGTSPVVAEGIRWAVEEGADVINLSLAQDGPGEGGLVMPENLLRDPSVDRAIRDAAAAGRTVVIAAGNTRTGGRGETAYDATVPGAIVVGASTKDDRRAAYADYGRGLDVVAPGGGSATNPSDSACTEKTSIVSAWWNPETRRNAYGGGCGTSMAVGFVSGLAAMLHARGMSNDRVVKRIVATTDDIGARGVDSQTGHGRINAARALGAKIPVPTRRAAPKASAPAVVRPRASDPPVRAAAGSPAEAAAPAATSRSGRAANETRLEGQLAAPPVRGTEAPSRPVPLAAAMVAALLLLHGWRATFRGGRAR